jgi:hypothetical protein
VTGDKKMAHNFAPQTKEAQIGWENSASPTVKKKNPLRVTVCWKSYSMCISGMKKK